MRERVAWGERPGKAAALMTPIDTPLIDAAHVARLMERFERITSAMTGAIPPGAACSIAAMSSGPWRSTSR